MGQPDRCVPHQNGNRTLAGRHWRKSSFRKVPSATPVQSPNNCCIHRSSWVGFLSPSSSVLRSCCSFLCLEAAVHLISCSLRVVYGLSGVGCRMRSRTSIANSGERDATTWSNIVFWVVILWVSNFASAWANHTSRSAGQNGGSLMLTATITGGESASSVMFSLRVGVTNVG